MLPTIVLAVALLISAPALAYDTAITTRDGRQLEITLGDPEAMRERLCDGLADAAANQLDQAVQVRAELKLQISELEARSQMFLRLWVISIVGIGAMCMVLGGVFWPRGADQ